MWCPCPFETASVKHHLQFVLAETKEDKQMLVFQGVCTGFRVWEAHKPAQRRQPVLQSTSPALPPLEWCPQKLRFLSRTSTCLHQHLPYIPHTKSTGQEVIFFFKQPFAQFILVMRFPLAAFPLLQPLSGSLHGLKALL